MVALMAVITSENLFKTNNTDHSLANYVPMISSLAGPAQFMMTSNMLAALSIPVTQMLQHLQILNYYKTFMSCCLSIFVTL